MINTIPYEVLRLFESKKPESIVYVSIMNCRNGGSSVTVAGMKMDSSLVQKKDGAKLLNITCILTETHNHYSLAIRNDRLYENLLLFKTRNARAPQL